MIAASLSVFVHAVGFTGQSLAPIAARAPGGALCLDVVGHGNAPAPADYVFTWRGAAERLLLQLRDGGPVDGPRFGFGHSGGGSALLWCEILAPGTFDALFLYEPPLRLLRPEEFASSGPDLAESVKRRRNRFETRAQFEAYLRQRSPYRDFSDEALAAYVRSGLRHVGQGGYELACAPEFEAGIYGSRDATLLDRLDEVAIPVVVAQGAHTHERFTAIGPALVERLRDGRLVIVPGLSHFGPLEAPETVATVFAQEMEAAMQRMQAPNRSRCPTESD